MHWFIAVLAHHSHQRHTLPGNDLEKLTGTRALFPLLALFPFPATMRASDRNRDIQPKKLSHPSGIRKSASNPSLASHESHAPGLCGDSTAPTLAISQGLRQHMRQGFMYIASLSRIVSTKWLQLLASKKTSCPRGPVSQKISFWIPCRWRVALRFFVHVWAQVGAGGEVGYSASPREAVHRGGSQPPHGRASAEYLPARDLCSRLSWHIARPACWHPTFIVILSAHKVAISAASGSIELQSRGTLL
jgi:hypothetical protein